MAAPQLSLKDFIAHLAPVSIPDAMARNEILQIVVVSTFVGAAISSLETKAPLQVTAAEQLAQVMLRITRYVMALAPLVTFCALASAVGLPWARRD